MIPREEFDKLKGKPVGVGVPNKYGARDLFFHYGTLLRTYETAIVLDTNRGIRIIEISHILEVREA